MKTEFTRLNDGWNAEPNAPYPEISLHQEDLVLTFYLNPYLFPEFHEGDKGAVTFKNCWRYRLGSTNDEGWYEGQCCFSKLAPAWGEFYEVKGDLLLDMMREEWHTIGPAIPNSRHFLFYFRDDTFECDAEDWFFEVHVQPE